MHHCYSLVLPASPALPSSSAMHEGRGWLIVVIIELVILGCVRQCHIKLNYVLYTLHVFVMSDSSASLEST